MRVAVVHNLRSGGARRRLAEQLPHLGAEVVEICLATAEPVTDEPLVVPYGPIAPSLPPVVRPPLRYLDLERLRRAWSGVAAAVTRVEAEVVFANPCRYVQAPPALLTTRVPSLYFCDEPRRIDYEPAAASSRNPRTRALYARLHAAERRLDSGAVARATRLATNSRFTAAAIERAYGREAEVVPLGVAGAFVPGPGPEPRHLLSVGTLIPDKGHELAIRAAALSETGWPVVLVAPRDEPDERSRLHAVARSAGVALSVRIGITDEELRDAYRAAHATLCLARAEPLGLAALEAQACGCPVIVADEGGLPETVRDGATGFAVPREPGAAAARLALLADAAVRQRFGAAAAAHAGATSWRSSAAAVEAILEGLCASRS